MNIKVEDVFLLVDGFNELNQKDLPVSMSFKLQKNSFKVNEEVELITKMRQSIVDKYKKLEEDNEGVDYYEIATKELEELDSQETDIDLQMISAKELEECGILIKPMTLMQLEKVISEED